MKLTTSILALLSIGICSSHAAVIFQLNETLSLSHSSANSTASPPTAGSTTLTAGTFSWDNLSTDSGGNTAEFAGTSFSSADWGGLGQYVSNSLDVSTFTEATITFAGTSNFNTNTEFYQAFYTLDSNPEVIFVQGIEDVNGPVTASPTIDLSSASTMTVGFRYNHNGGSDFATVSNFTVDAIPEPTTTALFGIASLALLRRRRH